MALQNRVTEILGIKYPIMQGGMQNLATPRLAAAVSNAGGLGTINMGMWTDAAQFRKAVLETKSLTDKPICVNISMLPHAEISSEITEYIKICGEEGAEAIETSGKNPAELIALIHSYGIKLIHKVPSVKHALKAESVGVDIVSIVGAEAAGHPSPDLISTSILGAKAAEKLKIPYLLGGGIADGRGLVAMLALGADGVVIGTRFIASLECIISENHKKWIVNASEQDTVLCQQAIRNTMRCAKNAAALECLEIEKKPGVTLSDLMPIISGAVGEAAYKSGDISKGIFPVGQSIGLINEIKSASQIISDMVAEASSIIGNLNNRYI